MYPLINFFVIQTQSTTISKLYFEALAVFVVHQKNLASATDPIPFDHVQINLGGHFNEVTYQLTIPEDAIYFVT